MAWAPWDSACPRRLARNWRFPDACVINVSGDGSIMMNLQELATLRRYDLPVKIVLFDNRALGMVRQWQELFHDTRYSEVDLSDNPDFCRVAGIHGHSRLSRRRSRGCPSRDRPVARGTWSSTRARADSSGSERLADRWSGRSNSEMLHEHEVAREVAR